MMFSPLLFEGLGPVLKAAYGPIHYAFFDKMYHSQKGIDAEELTPVWQVREADGHAEKRWLENEAEFRDVLRGEFGLNMTDEEIDRCVAVMKIKGTGDAPHPFFA
jgi:hypothetical protein